TLRRDAAAATDTTATTFVVRIDATATTPALAAHPSLPGLTRLLVERDGDSVLLEARFDRPAPVRAVLSALGRSVLPGHLDADGWPDVATGATAVAFDSRADFPPDLLVAEEPVSLAGLPDPHPVLARAPVVVATGAEPTWGEVDLASVDGGPLVLGPLDERLLNPTGFKRQHRKPVARLVPHEEEGALGLRTAGGISRLGAGHGPSPSDIEDLRRLAGVHLSWEGARGPHDYARFVAGLAMAGVPLTSHQVPAWAAALLHPSLVAAIEGAPAHLEDIVLREAYSIRLRRVAIDHHGRAGWRRDAGRAHGLQTTPATRVSVLLPTRRPEQVPFALRQVARQRGVDLELVLATHGFVADEADIAAFRRSCDVPLTVLEAPGDLAFGAVLNLAVRAASGDLFLKMDDDDWYGRDFVSDLLLARRYSGADVVGTPPEFTFVEPLWLTVRRQDATEAFRPVVAGGTMLIDRGALVAVGGFRETRKYVDAGLLRAVVDAGGTVYRSHGHGYVLRRGGQGHTWDPGLGYFVGRKLSWQQWRGFRPSPLLEPDDEDRPRKGS
ncbi:MAG: glycosyltransferase, partial [Nocardioides sp.]